MATQQEAIRKGRLTQKRKRELKRQIWSKNPGLEVVHPHAADIDIGNREHYVAVAPDSDGEPVQRFGCFTGDLHAIAQHLRAHGVRTVAMQSTGVCWIPVVRHIGGQRL